MRRAIELAPRIELIIVEVCDYDAAVPFYRDVLGLTFIKEETSDRWAEFDAGGGVLLAVFGRLKEPPKEQGAIMLDFTVPDLEAERERIARLGVDVGEIQQYSDEYRLFTLNDPEGNRIQIFEWLDR